MAQFFDDFSGSTPGSPPTGWSRQGFVSNALTNVIEDPDRTGINIVAPDFTASGASNGLLRWDTVGSVSGAVEVIARVRWRNIPATDPRNGLGARMAADGTTGYTLSNDYAFYAKCRWSSFTSRTALGYGPGISSGNPGFPALTWFWMRVRIGVTGTNEIQTHAAPDVAGQPGTWVDVGDGTHTDATYTSGYVGARYGDHQQLFDIDQIGVGTAGDSAPTSGGPAAPAITDAGDETFSDGETGIVITGTNLPTTAGSVIISPTDNAADGNVVAQAITNRSGGTSVTFTAARGALAAGTNLYLFVTNDDSQTNAAGYVVQFAPRQVFPPTRLRAQSSAVSGSGAVS